MHLSAREAQVDEQGTSNSEVDGFESLHGCHYNDRSRNNSFDYREVVDCLEQQIALPHNGKWRVVVDFGNILVGDTEWDQFLFDEKTCPSERRIQELESKSFRCPPH